MALALGQPVGTLARTMGEGEFIEWQCYAAGRMLPWRRMEMHLAQIAMLLATANGNEAGLVLKDFLFDAAPDGSGEPTAEEEIEFFNFQPYKKKVT